jgi:hypothetical protein
LTHIIAAAAAFMLPAVADPPRDSLAAGTGAGAPLI